MKEPFKIKNKFPELMKYLVNKEDGELTYGSHNKITVVCPLCGETKDVVLKNLVNQGFSCPLCSSKTSTGEKIIFSILRNFNLDVKKEYSPDWANKKRYDFFVPSLNTIIEVNGIQHYENSNRGRTLIEEQENDILKKELAVTNNINYIVIDARDTRKENFQKEIKNKFNSLFDIENIDFDKIWEEVYSSSIILDVCKDYSENKMKVIDIANKYGIDKSTLYDYINKMNISKRTENLDKELLTYQTFLELGNKSEVARILNINLRTVYRHIEKIKKETL